MAGIEWPVIPAAPEKYWWGFYPLIGGDIGGILCFRGFWRMMWCIDDGMIRGCYLMKSMRPPLVCSWAYWRPELLIALWP